MRSSREENDKLLAEYLASGLTPKAFADQRGGVSAKKISDLVWRAKNKNESVNENANESAGVNENANENALAPADELADVLRQISALKKRARELYALVGSELA